MKNTIGRAIIAMCFVPAFASAQAPQGWEAGVKQFDTAFWNAYNQCDIKKLKELSADDLEFYHDAFHMKGKVAFASAMEKNICGNPVNHIRREAIADSIHLFPLMENGMLYGAIMEGNHKFFATSADKKEVPTDRARFSHLLLFKDGSWQLSRVYSYDHQPIQSEALLPEVQLAPAALNALAGNYKAKDGMALTVTPEGNHLIAVAGGAKFELYPTGEYNFSMKTRDIKVEFLVDQVGKGQSLVVREHGQVVAEAAVVAK